MDGLHHRWILYCSCLIDSIVWLMNMYIPRNSFKICVAIVRAGTGPWQLPLLQKFQTFDDGGHKHITQDQIYFVSLTFCKNFRFSEGLERHISFFLLNSIITISSNVELKDIVPFQNTHRILMLQPDISSSCSTLRQTLLRTVLQD